MKLRDGLAACDSSPFHSSSAVHSRSSSSPPPSAAGRRSAPLCTPTGTTAVLAPDVPTGQRRRFQLFLVRGSRLCTIKYCIFSVSMAFTVAQTLEADCSAFSLKVCSNSSLCLNSSCFCWSFLTAFYKTKTQNGHKRRM